VLHQKRTYIFAAYLPTRLLLVKFLCDKVTIVTETNYDVTLDRAQAADPWGSRCTSHGANGNFKWRTSWRMAVIGQLAVVQVTLEEHKVRTREVQEQIRCLAMQIPIRVSCTPERMLLVHPFPLLLVLLEADCQLADQTSDEWTEYSPSSDLRASSVTPFQPQKPSGKGVRRPWYSTATPNLSWSHRRQTRGIVCHGSGLVWQVRSG